MTRFSASDQQEEDRLAELQAGLDLNRPAGRTPGPIRENFDVSDSDEEEPGKAGEQPGEKPGNHQSKKGEEEVPLEQVIPLEQNEEIIETSQLSDEMILKIRKQQEDSYSDELREYLKITHGEFRGVDRPGKAQFCVPKPGTGDNTQSKSKNKDMSGRERQRENEGKNVARNSEAMADDGHLPAILAFPDLLDANKETGMVAGELIFPVPEEDKGASIFITHLMNSQLPGLLLTVANRGTEADGVTKKKNALVYIPANCVDRRFEPKENDIGDYKYVDFRMRASWDTSFQDHELKDDPRLKKNIFDKEHGAATITEIGLLAPSAEGNEAEPRAFGPPTRRPIFLNIDQTELADLAARAERRDFGDPALDTGEWALLGLYEAQKMTLIRPWKNTPAYTDAYNSFREYFTASMTAAVMAGNFPYYQNLAERQGVSISDENFNLDMDMVPPPFHLVQKWRVTFQDVPKHPETEEILRNQVWDTGAQHQGKKQINAKPERWTQFDKGPDALRLTPDSETTALATRIGINRQRAFDEAAVKTAFGGKDEVSLTGTFRPTPNPNAFWAEITVDEDKSKTSALGKHRKAELALDTRVKLSIKVGDGDGTDLDLDGTVQPDVWGTGVSIAALVRTKPNDPKPEDGKEYKVVLELREDGTSSKRQDSAICVLSRPLQRTGGVDIAHWGLGAAKTIGNPGKLYDDVRGRQEVEKAFHDALEAFTLNNEQKEAAWASFRSDNGLLHLWGPPGTGKSHALQAMITGHILAGIAAGKKRQTLVCAPNNSAVLSLAKKYIQTAKENRIEMCIFTGAFVEPPAKDSAGAGRKAAENNYAWDMIENFDRDSCADPELWDYYLHNRVYAWIKKLSKTNGHDYQEQARFEISQKRILASQASDAEKEQARKNRRDTKLTWYKRYLEEHNDVMFTTNSSAAHQTPRSFFHPKILITDEAAFGTRADCLTPAAVYCEDIELWIMAGDHKQLQPPILSRGFNECLKHVQQTLFIVLENSLPAALKKMLKEQHRMRPYLSRMISELWYGGQLRDHASVTGPPSELMETLFAGLQPLAPYLGNRRKDLQSLRFAVDVSGEGTQEQRDDMSTSTYNTGEVMAVWRYIQFLINLKPGINRRTNARGRVVEPSDIVVVSPYASQIECMRQCLQQNNYAHRGISLLTSAKVQGNEGKIVLLSLVRNKEEAPLSVGFVADSKQQCVNNSRAMEHLVTFGNWQAWAMDQVTGGQKMNQLSKGKFRYFARVVKDYREHRELVSTEHFWDLVMRRALRQEDDIFLNLVESAKIVKMEKAPTTQLKDLTRQQESRYEDGAPGQKRPLVGTVKRTIGGSSTASAPAPQQLVHGAPTATPAATPGSSSVAGVPAPRPPTQTALPAGRHLSPDDDEMEVDDAPDKKTRNQRKKERQKTNKTAGKETRKGHDKRPNGGNGGGSGGVAAS